MSQHMPDTLLVYLAPEGSVPLPSAFQDAAIRFEQARVEYEQRHQFDESAQHFLEAARLLLHVGGFHASTAAANRLSCYRNAWSAFSAAGDRNAGRAALTAAAEVDLVHADRIRDMIRNP